MGFSLALTFWGFNCLEIEAVVLLSIRYPFNVNVNVSFDQG